MKYLVQIVTCLIIALMLTIAQPAYAVKIKDCGKLPAVIVEDLRNVRGGYLRADREFLNSEKKLPAIDKGYMYNEYTLDQDNPNPGDRGKYRAVGRVGIGKITPVDPVYVTMDHYLTFCKS